MARMSSRPDDSSTATSVQREAVMGASRLMCAILQKWDLQVVESRTDSSKECSKSCEDFVDAFGSQ